MSTRLYNYLQFSIIALICLSLLLLNIGNYYFQKIFTFIVFFFCIFAAIDWNKAKDKIFTIIFSLFAIIINPFIPFHMNDMQWRIIEIVYILIILCTNWIIYNSEKY